MHGSLLSQQNCFVKWIEQRNLILKLLMEVAGSTEQEEQQKHELINLLFESVIDYAAYGHFKVFPELFGAFKKLPHELAISMSNLYKNTTYLLLLNSRYAKISKLPFTLRNDLSKLGKFIAERLEIEDGLFCFSR